MKLSNPLKFGIATVLTGIIILFLVIYVEQKTISVSKENIPLVALAEHIKNKSKDAHVWFEKAMRRDKSAVFQIEMYSSLDSTVKLFKQVLEGGETELGVFHKTTNIEIFNTINQLLQNSIEIKLLAEQRMELIMKKSVYDKRKNKKVKTPVLAKGEEVGGTLDQEFDASYEKLQGNYEGLATLIKLKVQQDEKVLNNLFWISILLITVVFGVFCFLMYRLLKTERKAGNALRVGEERFRTIFEEAPLGIALIDSVTGVIHEINPKYSEIIGRKKEEMNNMNWMSITHPDDLQESLAKKKLMNETKLKSFKISKRYIHSNGSVIWGDVSIARIETENKSQNLHLCMVQDITEHKRSEEKIKESQENYRSLVDNVTDIIMTADLEDKITFINFTGGGYTGEQVIGRSVYEMVSPEYHDLVKKIHTSVKENKTAQSYETMAVGADGVSKWFLTNVGPVFSDDKVIGITLFTKDITKRKQTEEALKTSENELRGMFACMDDLIFELSNEGTYLKVGPTNPSLLFKPADSLLGKRLDEVFPEKEAQRFISKIKQALSEKKALQLEYSIPINNETLSFEATLSPLTEVSVLCIARDVTARKKMENLLKEKEQNALLLRHASQVPGALYQFQISPDGKFLFPFVSQGIAELYEVSPEEVMRDGAKLFNCVHPDDLEGLMFSINQSLKTFENWKYEYRIILPLKGTRWIRGNSKPEKLPDGSTLWHGYLADITEPEEAKKALQISKDKQEAVFNGSNDAITLLTRKGYFDCNPKTLEMFGMSNKKEFIESHPSDYSPAFQPDGQESFIKANAMIEIAFENGVNRFEWMHQRKNGNAFPCEVLLSAFNYGNERVLQATVHDITHRKLAEKRLTESEALLASILETLPVAVFCKDIKNDFKFSVWNKKAEGIFGLKAEECIGKSDYDFFSKKDADWYRKNDQETIKMTGILDIPEEVVESSNKKVIVHTKKIIVRDMEGNPRFLLGVSEDITERKLAEKRLLEYKHFFDNSADFSCIANTEGYFETLNQNFEKTLGYSENELLENQFLSFVHPDDIDSTLKEIEKLKTGTITTRFVNRYRKKDGSYLWFSWNTTPNQETGKLYAIARDITEQKEAEEKIKKSEEKYRSVVENAVDMIITFDRSSLITFANHLRPGTRVEDVLGKSIYNLVPEAYRGHVKEKVEKVFESKSPQSYELPGKHLDGSSAWYSANMGPVFSGDKVSGITLILRDVTDRKKAEEKIQQSLKEKEVLLQEVHHRVKNNLQIMLSILNLQYANITDKKLLDLVRDIRSRIKAMSFIHELLYQTNDFSSINFSEYITNITNNLLYSYSQDHTIDLKLDVGTVFLDLDRAIPCGLIINEIVTNSLKYGFIYREKGEVSISLTQKNELIQLIIADNGSGLPDNVDYRNTESLGMQLVVTLVQQLNGEISLDNSNGAKYTITFKTITKPEIPQLEKLKIG